MVVDMEAVSRSLPLANVFVVFSGKRAAIASKSGWIVLCALCVHGYGLLSIPVMAESLTNPRIEPGVLQPLKPSGAKTPSSALQPLTPNPTEASSKTETTIEEEVIGPIPPEPRSSGVSSAAHSSPPGVSLPSDSPLLPSSSHPIRETESSKESVKNPKSMEKESPLSNPSGDASEGALLDSPRFILKEILIRGVTVFKASQLEAKFSAYIDKPVNLQDLLKIAGDITQLYKENGYITSRAFISPQDINEGSVTIDVQEGRVGEVQIQGNQSLRQGYLKARIQQKSGDVFRLQALQKDMLYLNGDPLLDKVHATLKAGLKPGTNDLLLEVDDHQPLHMMVGVDNLGRNGIGLWRTQYTVLDENVLGFGDSGYVSAVLASKTVAASGQYQFPLNRFGWKVGANYGFTHVNLGETASPIFIDPSSKIRTLTGNSQQASLFTDFPIYRSLITQRWMISGNVGFNVFESMSYLDGHSLQEVEHALKLLNPGLQKSVFPSLRTLTSTVRASRQDEQGRWLLNASMTNGFAAFGGNMAYVKFNTDLSRIQKLPMGMIGIFRAQGQLTPNRLPFAEKMQIGGSDSVRGYGEGFLMADGGYFLGAELRYPLPFLPLKLKDQWQGLAFVEHGRVFACGNAEPSNALGRPGSLLGYGVGLRGRVSKYLNARLDLGMSTTRNRSQPDIRAHFSLSSQLF